MQGDLGAFPRCRPRRIPIRSRESPCSRPPRRGLGDGSSLRGGLSRTGQLCTRAALCWGAGSRPWAPSGPGAPNSRLPTPAPRVGAAEGPRGSARGAGPRPQVVAPRPLQPGLGWRCCSARAPCVRPGGARCDRIKSNGAPAGHRRCGRRCLWESLGVTEDTAPIELFHEMSQIIPRISRAKRKKSAYPDLQRNHVGAFPRGGPS